MIKIFYITILLFLLGCDSRNISVDIPKFNQDVAFKHLVDQCNYGPRNPVQMATVNSVNIWNLF